MPAEKIYLIERNSWREDYDSRPYTDITIEEDEGFFTDEAEALAHAEALSRPGRERHVQAVANYERRVEEERQKTLEAQRLGFRHQGNLWHRPDEPDWFTVVEVNRAK